MQPQILKRARFPVPAESTAWEAVVHDTQVFGPVFAAAHALYAAWSLPRLPSVEGLAGQGAVVKQKGNKRWRFVKSERACVESRINIITTRFFNAIQAFG